MGKKLLNIYITSRMMTPNVFFFFLNSIQIYFVFAHRSWIYTSPGCMQVDLHEGQFDLFAWLIADEIQEARTSAHVQASADNSSTTHYSVNKDFSVTFIYVKDHLFHVGSSSNNNDEKHVFPKMSMHEYID